MKVSSLVIALIAIFSVFASATIEPVSFKMRGLKSQFAVAKAEFKSTIDYDEDQNRGQVAFFFPGWYAPESVAFTHIDCTTVTGVNSSTFGVKRHTVTRVNDPKGFTRINHGLFFGRGEIVGTTITACSFIAPDALVEEGTEIHASIAVGSRSSIQSSRDTLIRPSNSVFGNVEAYISPTFNMNKPTAFKLSKVHYYASGNEITIRNPDENFATNGAQMVFSTNTASALCDVYWDGVLYKNSAQATILGRDAGGIHLVFGSPLHSAKELILYCPDIRGIPYAPGFVGDSAKFFPSILEFSYAGDTYLHKSLTVAITPARPETSAFEKSDVTVESPFPYFTPKSIFE